MAANLGYIDRLGAVTNQSALAYAREYGAVAALITSAYQEDKDRETKLSKAETARIKWDELEEKNDDEIKNHPAVLTIRKTIMSIFDKVINQIAILRKKQADTFVPPDEGTSNGNGSSTDTDTTTKDIPWLPIGIVAAAVAAAFMMQG